MESTWRSRYFVDMNRVREESLAVIDEEMQKEPDEAGFCRREPLMFSCLARGGKTTVLTTLFDELKAKGYLVMLVSFKGMSGFDHQPHDTQAILRHIIRQLIDRSAVSNDELLDVHCSEDVFDAYLDQQTRYQSSSSVPFVMLFDELNVVGAPLSPTASKMLQRLFLRKNRYLVFSTHVPFSLSANETFGQVNMKSVVSWSSFIDVRVVKMPHCTDMSELRKMEQREALTGHEATIYGGIPALIYCARNHRNSPSRRFLQAWGAISKVFLRDDNVLRLLIEFLTAAFTGERNDTDPRLHFFYQFGTVPEQTKVRWPLCYLSEILSVLKPSDGGVRKVINEIHSLCSRSIPVFASMVETGLDWQCVVEVAVLLRALEAWLMKTDHPFLPSLSEVKLIQFVTMPDDIQTLKQARKLITNLPHRDSHLVVVRSSFAKFPLFDGFVVGMLPTGSVVTGYQVKLGRRTPRSPVPSWVNGGGLLVRGLAPSSTRDKRPSGWTFMNRSEIETFLGYSLASLYPAVWVPGVPSELLLD